jgi:hypothetical protein
MVIGREILPLACQAKAGVLSSTDKKPDEYLQFDKSLKAAGHAKLFE